MSVPAFFLLGLTFMTFADPLQPTPIVSLDDLQTARALSLQLRGTVPTIKEMTDIEEAGGVDAERLNAAGVFGVSEPAGPSRPAGRRLG